MRFLTPALLVIAMALPAAARPLEETEQAALMKAVDSYLRATGSKNAEAIVATIPPRLVNVFAGTTGVEAAKVKTTLVSQTKDLLKTTSIYDFVASKGPFDATDSKLSDGTEVTWVVVPVQFTIESPDKKTRNAQSLFAVEEDGAWYFSRIDGPQQQKLLSLAYPFIAETTLPEATTTTIQ